MGPQMKNRRFGHTTIVYGDNLYHIGGHIPNDGYQSIEKWSITEVQHSRKRRSAWSEGIPYNPKPFLYDGWSVTNYDHDPTLQNYFFRNKQDYSPSSSVFKYQNGTDIPQDNFQRNFSISDFFNGTFKNKLHGGQPFFENVREAYLSPIKYAPCKYCNY